jgi:predicted RNA binding protein YcfA (HicA-like mRNA interferase family)
MASSREIAGRLEKEGWELARQSGSHRQYKHPTRPGRVTLPHPVKDIPVGTLRSIYRQAGWAWPP